MSQADPQPPAAAGRACPSCHVSMHRQRLPSRGPTGVLDLDICFDCHGIWFDPFESAQLSARAVLVLFEMIRKQDAPARPLATTCTCPVCHHRLALTHDLERTNRITYFRCPDHGRFTTYMQFMREKNFVRTLSPAEVNRLRAVVTQVRCSSCGGPIDLGRDAECSYCHAPIAILDADAVSHTVAELNAADGASRPVASASQAISELMDQARADRKLPLDLVRDALTSFLTSRA